MKFKIENNEINANLASRLGFQFKLENEPLYFTDFKSERDIVHMLFVFKRLNVYFLNEKKEVIQKKLMYPFISFSKIPKQTKYILEVPLI